MELESYLFKLPYRSVLAASNYVALDPKYAWVVTGFGKESSGGTENTWTGALLDETQRGDQTLQSAPPLQRRVCL